MCTDDVRISKNLSWLLRHAAIREGLNISTDGFVRVAEILRHPRLNKCSVDDIKPVVDSNEKRKFNLFRNGEGELVIKANQGHSLQCVSELHLDPITSSEGVPCVVHGTYFKNWKGIQSSGLSRMNRVHIHFAEELPSDGVISGMRSNAQVLVYIDLDKALGDGLQFFRSPNGVILSPGDSEGVVVPKYFSKVVNAKTGFPNLVTKDVLSEFFKKLGPVLEYYIGEGNRYAIVQFKTAEAAEKVLNTKQFFMGKNVNIKPRILRDSPGKPDAGDENEKTFENLIDSLKNIRGFNLQMSVLMECIHPQNMHGKYLHLCTDLEKVLSSIFPTCKAHPFGSTVSGLDFKGSDVDCYINVPFPYSDAQSSNWRAQNLVKEAKKAMMKSPNFIKVVAIPKAKTPIVKCVHKPTNICCDFNFKNMLGVYNTHLISTYLNQAFSLKPAVIFLKCWGKAHGFIGTSGKFSSYAITMMFIYYLQQRPYNMPPAFALQRNSMYDNFQEGWNGGFCPYMPTNTELVKAKVESLLIGFFNFYAKFEYSLYMISPFYGMNILKTNFLKPEVLPPIFELYETNIRTMEPLQVETPICLQDPFELNYNITRSVTPRFLEEFIGYCKRACTLIEARGGDPCLYQLLAEDIDDTKFSVNSKTCTFKLIAGNSLAYIDKEISEDDVVTNKPKDLQDRWFEVVLKFLIRVLGRVFKFDLTVVRETGDIQDTPSKAIKLTKRKDVYDKKNTVDEVQGTPSKAIKLTEQKDVYDKKNTVDEVKLMCRVNVNLWEARRSISRDLHEADNIKGILEKQTFISDYMANDILKGHVSKEFFLGFDMTLHAVIEPMAIEVNIENVLDPKHQFERFCKYLVSKITNWFEIYEKECNAAVKEATKENADT